MHRPARDTPPCDSPQVVFFSSLFPSKHNPTHGIFVSELYRAVALRRKVMVIAPQNGLRLLFSLRKPVRQADEAAGDVLRPVCLTVPKIMKGLDARLVAMCSKRAFDLALAGGARLIHAHYAYPDAAAAMILAKRSNLPCIVTVHGSDINVLAQCPMRGKRIAETLRAAEIVTAVSRALAIKVQELGVPAARIRHIPNGVDLEKFSPAPREEARQLLGLPTGRRIILAVGRLEPVKGYDLLLQALPLLQGDVDLVFAGDGSQRKGLERLAGALGIAGCVHFAGTVPHERLAVYYRAADVLAISSHSEGWPTIIFEAMACGLPVVASAVGGIPEILVQPCSGILLKDNAPQTLAAGLQEGLSRRWDTDALVAYAREHDWHRIAERYESLYEQALARQVYTRSS